MKKIVFCVFMLAVTVAATAKNVRYAYDCTIMVSTDDARAPQSSFTYDRKANTFTIKPNNGSAGLNNVAWRIENKNNYYFGNDKSWFLIEADGVNPDKSKSIVWGCGAFWGAAPQTIQELENGHLLLLWNIRSNSAFNFSDLVLYTNGDVTLGLTSLGETATIYNVDFLAPAEVAMAYPEMRKAMACSTESLLNSKLTSTLTRRLADATKLTNGKSTEMGNGFVVRQYKDILEACKQKKATIDLTDNTAVCQLIASIDAAIDDFLANYKTYINNLPVVQTKFTADPAPFVVGDTLFLLAGHDHNEAYGFLMQDYLLYKTADMVNWTDCGAVVTCRDFPWANRYGWGDFTNGLWAPQVVPANGKFYLYAPLQGRGIAVLVADTPYGPWKDPIGDRLLSDDYDSIDPTVLVDDDGQAYLYWGNPNLWYVKLNKDMISYSGTPQQCNVQYSDELRARFKGQSLGENRFTYQEGPWAYKRNGKYYMAYASECCPEGIGYAMSDSPEGPWQCQGLIMDRDSRSSGNHPGIVDFKGKTYVFGFNYFLNFLDDSNHRERRSVAVTPLNFRDDGTIPTRPFWYNLPATAPLETLNPYQRTEAETIHWCEGVKTAAYSQRGICIDSIQHGGFTQVANVDFGEKGAGSLVINARVKRAPSTIQVYLDNLYESAPIATINLGSTTAGFVNYEANLTSVPTGIHDLYFLFTTEASVRKNLMVVDYWQFKPVDETPVSAPSTLQRASQDIYYTTGGIPVKHPTHSGIYVQKGRKVVKNGRE